PASEACRERNREGQGLPAARATATEDVTTGQGVGEGVHLDGEGAGDAGVAEGGDERTRNREIGKRCGHRTALPFDAACTHSAGQGPRCCVIAARKAGAGACGPGTIPVRRYPTTVSVVVTPEPGHPTPR